MHSMRLMAVAAIVALAACSSDKVTSLPAPVVPQATVLTVSGNIAAKVDEFRNLLGPANGGTAGEQTTGRREINWDGAGANPFDNAIIARVRIRLGTGVLGANVNDVSSGGTSDLVVLDNLIYGEPHKAL